MATALSPAAVTALRAATLTPDSITLHGQLDRGVYDEVNKVLTRIGGGGRWNRSRKAHVFTHDPKVELAGLLHLNEMPADRKRELSFFATPDPIADLMVDSAFIQRNDLRILEPSAGDGQLVRALYRKHPDLTSVQCVEIELDRAEYLAALGFSVTHDSFQRFAETCGRFDVILMNPPFTTPGDHLAWLTHTELALTRLAPGGRLVGIVPGGFTFRAGARFEALRELVGDDYTELPRDTFRAAGTTVATYMIEIVSARGGPPVVAPRAEQLSLFG